MSPTPISRFSLNLEAVTSPLENVAAPTLSFLCFLKAKGSFRMDLGYGL